MKTYTISAIILSREDNEKYLTRTLSGVKFCNEIILVLDTQKLHHSESENIARKFTQKIFARKLDNFSNQHNFALQKAHSEWILHVDSDEIIDFHLQKEIQKALKNPEISGYEIPFKNYMFGKWIRHTGWYPSWRLSLFRQKKVNFSRGVHEKISVKGKIARLKNHIIHYNYDTISQFIQKMDIYTRLEAEELFKQKIQFSIFRLFFRSQKEFVSRYFKNLGFLDGIYGLILSILMSFYWVLVYLKLWELQQSKNRKLN